MRALACCCTAARNGSHVTQANERRSYAVRAVLPANLGEQQRIADIFQTAGLLPKKIDATDVPIWKPGS